MPSDHTPEKRYPAPPPNEMLSFRGCSASRAVVTDLVHLHRVLGDTGTARGVVTCWCALESGRIHKGSHTVY